MITEVDPIAIALSVTRVFDSLGILHTIGGSLASSFAGEPRSTIDIDIVAAIDESHVPALTSAFSPDFYVDEEALRRAVRERSSANLIHHGTQLKIDVFVAGGTPLDHQQLSRRQEVTVGPGRTIHVHPPEDILLQKLRHPRHHSRSGLAARSWLSGRQRADNRCGRPARARVARGLTRSSPR